MASSLLKGKRILAVDDETDILEILEEELQDHGADVTRSSFCEDAIRRISSGKYDVVSPDIMGVRGFDLFELAVAKKMPVVMLTAHALSPESLMKSFDLGARAFLPKDQPGRIAPFLEDVLTLSFRPAWKSIFVGLGNSFAKRFGPDRRKLEKEFRERMDRDMELSESTIIEPSLPAPSCRHYSGVVAWE